MMVKFEAGRMTRVTGSAISVGAWHGKWAPTAEVDP